MNEEHAPYWPLSVVRSSLADANAYMACQMAGVWNIRVRACQAEYGV